jgi:hypothetical protein
VHLSPQRRIRYAVDMEIQSNSYQYRVPTEQRLQMLEQFRSSGLTRKAYCEQFGVSLATLGYWLKRVKRDSTQHSVPVVFSEVKLTAQEATSSAAWALEIVAPSGLTIRSKTQISIQDLAQLLRSELC